MNIQDFLPEDWQKLHVPIGSVLATLLILYGGWTWLHTTFVTTTDFHAYQRLVSFQLLSGEQARLETEVLRLSMKREVYPKQFDAVDKAILDKQSLQLHEVHRQLETFHPAVP